jgi:hypothetical protein
VLNLDVENRFLIRASFGQEATWTQDTTKRQTVGHRNKNMAKTCDSTSAAHTEQ